MKILSVQDLAKEAISENLTLPPLLHHKVDNMVPTMNGRETTGAVIIKR